MLNEGTLVLEGVTLGEVVQLVVEVLVDLSGGAVLDQKAAEDTETAHPEDLAVSPCQQLFHVRLLTALCYVACFISRAAALIGGVAYLGIRASAVPFLLPKPR